MTIQTDVWYDITIDDTEYQIKVDGRPEDPDGTGDRQVLVLIQPKNLPDDIADPVILGSPVNLNDDLAED